MFVDSPLSTVKVDKCFLDNTYLNPKFSNIPSQSSATQAIIKLIVNKLEQNYTVFGIKVNKLGKESLLVELCEAFKTQIAVSKTRYFRLTQTLNLDPKYFTIEFNDCLFYVLNDENEFGKSLRGQKKYSINPTALNMPTASLNLAKYIDKLTAQNSTYVQIPYTEHSNYNELIEFVKQLKPRELIPMNKIYSDCLSTTRLDKYLSKTVKREKREFSCIDCGHWWWNENKVR